MRKYVHVTFLIVLFMGSGSIYAQEIAEFNENPSDRALFCDQLTQQAEDGRKEAMVWAKAQGLPMRVDDGRQLMELMGVQNGVPVYYITHNHNAAISTSADKVRNTAPYNLNGAGVNVGVWDGGAVRTSHQEFGTRATVKDGTSATHYHATHVAGTIGAAGVQSNAKGMVPSASIHSYYWDNDFAEMTSAAASAPGQTGNKIYLSNHSYGRGVGWTKGSFINNRSQFGQYNSESSTMDQIVYNAQYYLPFWSAGNDRTDGSSGSSPVGDGYYKSGYDIISHEAIAKNVMTVGAVNDAVSGSSRNLSAATMATFSSWGPADDGRIKPDIVANGRSLYSPDDTADTGYRSISGTSMSSPNACGSAALLVEYYKELFSGGAMRASTLKGLIIHTADDRGRPGPDYEYGWGLMDTKAASDLLQEYAGGALSRITEETLTVAEPSDSYSFQWNGTEPIRVTLCWTDPAGSSTSGDDNRTANLVNDLDLKIMRAGVTYSPYKLSYSSPSSNATTGDNDVDNVEQVYIAAPVAGFYTITVDFEGSLTGGNQRYSLIITGDSGDADLDNIPDSWETIYFGGATNAVPTADLDNDGSDNYSEYVAGTLPNNAGSVFKMTSYSLSSAAGGPVVLNWSTMPGRVYSVGYTPNLQYTDFTVFPDAIDLPHTQNTYTDASEHSGVLHFYRVDVKLEQ